MNYIFESLFIGFYTFIFFNFTKINNKYLHIFVLGFIKHLLGYYLRLHNFYCYSKCNSNKIIYQYNIKILIYDSILEGLLFLSSLLFINYNSKSYFIFGILIHILFELLKFHKLFCKIRCTQM